MRDRGVYKEETPPRLPKTLIAGALLILFLSVAGTAVAVATAYQNNGATTNTPNTPQPTIPATPQPTITTATPTPAPINTTTNNETVDTNTTVQPNYLYNATPQPTNIPATVTPNPLAHVEYPIYAEVRPGTDYICIGETLTNATVYVENPSDISYNHSFKIRARAWLLAEDGEKEFVTQYETTIRLNMNARSSFEISRPWTIPKTINGHEIVRSAVYNIEITVLEPETDNVHFHNTQSFKLLRNYGHGIFAIYGDR